MCADILPLWGYSLPASASDSTAAGTRSCTPASTSDATAAGTASRAPAPAANATASDATAAGSGSRAAASAAAAATAGTASGAPAPAAAAATAGTASGAPAPAADSTAAGTASRAPASAAAAATAGTASHAPASAPARTGCTDKCPRPQPSADGGQLVGSAGESRLAAFGPVPRGVCGRIARCTTRDEYQPRRGRYRSGPTAFQPADRNAGKTRRIEDRHESAICGQQSADRQCIRDAERRRARNCDADLPRRSQANQGKSLHAIQSPRRLLANDPCRWLERGVPS